MFVHDLFSQYSVAQWCMHGSSDNRCKDYYSWLYIWSYMTSKFGVCVCVCVCVCSRLVLAVVLHIGAWVRCKEIDLFFMDLWSHITSKFGGACVAMCVCVCVHVCSRFVMQ